MTQIKDKNLSKVSLTAVRIRQSTHDRLAELAMELGKNSPAGLAAEILEACSGMKSDRYYEAWANYIKTGLR